MEMEEGRGEGSLGINNEIPYPKKVESRRALRFRLQSMARELLPGERVGRCLRAIAPEWRVDVVTGRRYAVARESVDVSWARQTGRAAYRNVLVCGSVWACPVCAGVISERRAQELAVIVGHPDYTSFLATLTFQHSIRDKLVDLLGQVKRAWLGFKKGGWWRRFSSAFGVVGTVKGLEVTHGWHGWHVHLHVLFVAAREGRALEDCGADGDLVEVACRDRWRSAIEQAGGYASARYGVKVSSSDAALAEYVSKWGHDPAPESWGVAREMGKAPVKRGRRGRAPFQLLGDAFDAPTAAARARARALFAEYYAVFKGSHQLEFSEGLRARFNLGRVSDGEAAADVQLGEVVLASLSAAQWAEIVRRGLRAELLDVADGGDAVRLVDWLWRRVGQVVHVSLDRLLDGLPACSARTGV